MTIENIQLWHRRARPNPAPQDFNVQLGCHFEEILEMVEALDFTADGVEYESKYLRAALRGFANNLKSGDLQAVITDRKELLDALADQVVTGIGVAHCVAMDGAEAIHRVNRSNWSKFDDDGMPIFNENGKIAKGPKYAPPDLEGLY